MPTEMNKLSFVDLIYFSKKKNTPHTDPYPPWTFVLSDFEYLGIFTVLCDSEIGIPYH